MQRKIRVFAVMALSLIVGETWADTKEGSQTNVKDRSTRLTCTWTNNILTIHGDHLPGKRLEVLYLEAYCRPGSTDRDWGETVIGHTTRLRSISADKPRLELECTLADGVTVRHTITCGGDEVDFRLTAHNPTDKRSDADWAQPCIRVGQFTGLADPADKYAYIKRCFIFLDGKLSRMPTANWATQARYTPGQVWCPAGVPRDDVNPRPLSPDVPSNGLIGCFSGDGRMIMATAWEPYQELFQGVIMCIHSDFRLGGLEPGETKHIRGKIYLVDNDVDALLKRYRKDFPEHVMKRKLVWADEFDGAALDTTKWIYRGLGRRRDAVNVKETVSFDGEGHLVLSTRRQGDKVQTAMIGTQGMFETTYGYFECRARLQKEIGHWSAFWLQTPTMGKEPGNPAASGTEIDIFEYLGREGDTVHHTLHWDGYGKDHKSAGKTPRVPGLSAGWHTFGLLWTPDEYVFYVDGRETWRTSEGISKRAEYTILSLEVGKWAGDISKAKLPDGALFDYVRVYAVGE